MKLITNKERVYINNMRNNSSGATSKDVIKIRYLVFKVQLGLWIEKLLLFKKRKQVDYTQWKLNRAKYQLEKVKTKRIRLEIQNKL